MFEFRWEGMDALRRGLQRLKQVIFPGAVGQIWRTAEKIRKQVSVPGKPVRYPVSWDTPKQKRAYFATNGFGRGIPTKRSGGYQKGYNVVRREDGADVRNPLAHAGYIGGTETGARQSRIQRGRWVLFRKVVDATLALLPKDVRDRLVLVIKGEGFNVK